MPNVLIGVGKDRVKAAQAAVAGRTVDCAILDDGFQHWRLCRNLDIVMVNAINPFGNGELIPRGILREPVSSLGRASVIVISHSNLVLPEALAELKKRVGEIAPQAFVVETFLEPLFFYRAKRRQRMSLDRLRNQRVTTFSGVGTPRSFPLILAQLHIKTVRNFEFSDHHAFLPRDLEEIKRVSEAAASQEIITTEKDFYRCQDLMIRTLNPLILATRLRISGGEEVMNERIRRLLEGRP